MRIVQLSDTHISHLGGLNGVSDVAAMAEFTAAMAEIEAR